MKPMKPLCSTTKAVRMAKKGNTMRCVSFGEHCGLFIVSDNQGGIRFLHSTETIKKSQLDKNACWRKYPI